MREITLLELDRYWERPPLEAWPLHRAIAQRPWEIVGFELRDAQWGPHPGELTVRVGSRELARKIPEDLLREGIAFLWRTGEMLELTGVRARVFVRVRDGEDHVPWGTFDPGAPVRVARCQHLEWLHVEQNEEECSVCGQRRPFLDTSSMTLAERVEAEARAGTERAKPQDPSDDLGGRSDLP